MRQQRWIYHVYIIGYWICTFHLFRLVSLTEPFPRIHKAGDQFDLPPSTLCRVTTTARNVTPPNTHSSHSSGPLLMLSKITFNQLLLPLPSHHFHWLYITGGKHKARGPIRLVLSGPAPCFYPAAAPSSHLTVKEYRIFQTIRRTPQIWREMGVHLIVWM